MDSKRRELQAAIERATQRDFQPRAWASELRVVAPELADALEHPELLESGERYTSKDAQAVQAKRHFVHYSSRASLSILVGTIAAALLVSSASAPPILHELGLPPMKSALVFVRSALAAMTVVLSSYALFCVTYLNRAGLLRRFREARSRAELERLGYFTTLAQRLPARSPARMAAFELFQRCQVDGQRAFFNARVDQARERHQRTVWIASIAVVIVALGGGGFGIAGLFAEGLLPLAGLSAIGAALASFASQREAVHQDERTIERYERTLEALSRLAERTLEVRKGIEGADPKVFEAYVTAVQEQLALEHHEWVEDSKDLDLAAEALEASLESLRSQG